MPFPPDWENLEKSLRTDVAAAIDTLLATVTALNAVTALTNAEINANPAQSIKVLTREVKTVARQLIRMARLMSGAFDSGDTGT
jgi:hypothetical protein